MPSAAYPPMLEPLSLGSSFRDPCGYVFSVENELYRAVCRQGEDDYLQLMESGLYTHLTETCGLLIPHTEVEWDKVPQDVVKVLRPEKIPFVSYPYEWCFGQMKDAALLTLEVMSEALSFGMILKDASAFNIQWHRGKPIFIDTLSFESYIPGEPWKAYQQFCRCFYGPLLVAQFHGAETLKQLSCQIHGVDLTKVNSLLPWYARFNLGVFFHIHLHSKLEEKERTALLREKKNSARKSTLSLNGLKGLLDQLKTNITRLSPPKHNTTWGQYYEATNYSTQAFEDKKRWVSKHLDFVKPQVVWDVGANRGEFSRLASQRGFTAISFDMDTNAVEQNYQQTKEKSEAHLLPLVMDLSMPSPALGWGLKERASLLERGPVDMILALALVHHLYFTNNVPFAMIGEFFAQLTEWLCIEFVPGEDSKVQELTSRKDVDWKEYSQSKFENAFLQFFTLERSDPISDSNRILYLMKKRCP